MSLSEQQTILIWSNILSYTYMHSQTTHIHTQSGTVKAILTEMQLLHNEWIELLGSSIVRFIL